MVKYLLIAMLVATAAHAKNGVVGQNEWCYVSDSDVMYCDYVTLSSCKAAHQDGSCVRR